MIQEVDNIGEIFIFNKGQSLAIDDIQKADIPAPLKSNIEVLGIRAITGIAIKSEYDIWGTLSIATSYPRHWTQDEISIIEAAADQIYLAIKQAELYSTTKELAEREETLRRITETIRRSLDLSETFSIICKELTKLLMLTGL